MQSINYLLEDKHLTTECRGKLFYQSYKTIIMQVNVLNREIVNLNLTADSNGYSTVYSTMSPLQSPYFESASDLFVWFNSLTNNEKKSYITNRNHIVIYNHTVDTIGRELYIKGKVYYTTHKNEIVSTDEAYIYDFTTNQFL